MSARIAIELSDRELEQLDRVVARGDFDSREAALHEALRNALCPDEDELTEAYRRAYDQAPEDGAWRDVGLRLAADSLRCEH